MAETLTPRQMVKSLLQGVPPSRSLLVPIVFSLGAKIENVPRQEFLASATKISNSLRQIHGRLHADGVTCYFDSYLELEALGATLRWQGDDQPPAIVWPGRAEKGKLPEGLRSPEQAARTGRVKVAVEVIGRLKSLLHGEPLLMAGVTGPFTLAARLTRLGGDPPPRFEDVPDAAFEFAASMTTQISAALVEAGANLIFVHEESLPVFSAEGCEAWASSLGPAFNIIRFYQALPVLHVADAASFAQNSALILQQSWDCVICPPLDAFPPEVLGNSAGSNPVTLGLALPHKFFQPDSFISWGHRQSGMDTASKPPLALLTTVGDIPADLNLDRLAKIFEDLARTGNL
jgi:hypothetical protein